MIVPTTYISALLLLILSFFCLGSWINTFKLTGPRWRFELFSIDFAIGAALLSVIAAFTLGTLGSDLAFTDRMLVAGHTAQAVVVAAGFIFNLGNMLLLSAASLVGISAAFPLSIGVALVVNSFFNFRGDNVLFLVSGIVLMMVGLVLDARSCGIRDRAAAKARAAAKGASPPPAAGTAAAGTGGQPTVSTATAPKTRKVAHTHARRKKSRRTTKGLVVGLLGGVALGLFYPVAAMGMTGDFGLGPYAGELLFSLGVLVSTIIFNFYFLNIAIDGEPLSFGAYFQGRARQHFLGFGGGALWAGGVLAALLARSASAQNGLNPVLVFILTIGSALLPMLWGSLSWKEFTPAPASAKLSLGLTAVFFSASLILFAFGIMR